MQHPRGKHRQLHHCIYYCTFALFKIAVLYYDASREGILLRGIRTVNPPSFIHLSSLLHYLTWLGVRRVLTGIIRADSILRRVRSRNQTIRNGAKQMREMPMRRKRPHLICAVRK